LFCIFLFIFIYYSDFSLFVLCYGFLISFLFQSVPVLHSTTIFLCHPTMHVLSVTSVALVHDFWPSFCLLWIYLLNNHILHFLPFPFSNLAHADILLCLATAHVRISSHVKCLSSKLHRLLHSPYLPTTPTNPTVCHHATENLPLPTLFPI